MVFVDLNLCWASFEKLPIIGSYICIIRQIWDYLYSYAFMIKWMVLREVVSPHIDLILNDCSEFNGRTAVLTGGTRGIGANIVKKLLQVNLNVIMGCRDPNDGEKLVNTFRKQGIKTGTAVFVELDLSSLKSVRKFAAEVISMEAPVHLLINNAGIMGVPFKETKDGFESQFQVNFLSHFLLINSLLPAMIKTASNSNLTGRIINVNAAAMYHARLDMKDLQLRKRYNPFIAYFNSKLLQVIMTRHLSAKLKLAGINSVHVNTVHPGVVATDLVSHMRGFNYIKSFMEAILMTPDQGADDVLYVALSSHTEKESGEFFVHRKICTRANPYFCSRIQKQVWEEACKYIGIQSEFDVTVGTQELNGNLEELKQK